jgi:hypothetical protein
MVSLVRLVTFVEVDDRTDIDTVSVSARHELELADGSRVLLLADRGWAESGPPNIWAYTSVDDIVNTARVVVGPDEPFGDRTHEDMEGDHWDSLQQTARGQGVMIGDVGELRRLPHDVVLGPRLRVRLGA